MRELKWTMVGENAVTILRVPRAKLWETIAVSAHRCLASVRRESCS